MLVVGVLIALLAAAGVTAAMLLNQPPATATATPAPTATAGAQEPAADEQAAAAEQKARERVEACAEAVTWSSCDPKKPFDLNQDYADFDVEVASFEKAQDPTVENGHVQYHFTTTFAVTVTQNGTDPAYFNPDGSRKLVGEKYDEHYEPLNVESDAIPVTVTVPEGGSSDDMTVRVDGDWFGALFTLLQG